MRLTPAKIEDLTRKLLEALRQQEGVVVKDEAKARALIRQAITENLTAEDKLDEEVRAILRQHASAIHGKNLDYDQLFLRAKRQLAKEKGFVL